MFLLTGMGKGWWNFNVKTPLGTGTSRVPVNFGFLPFWPSKPCISPWISGLVCRGGIQWSSFLKSCGLNDLTPGVSCPLAVGPHHWQCHHQKGRSFLERSHSPVRCRTVVWTTVGVICMGREKGPVRTYGICSLCPSPWTLSPLPKNMVASSTLSVDSPELVPQSYQPGCRHRIYP